jgi:RHS repeat-associated protein
LTYDNNGNLTSIVDASGTTLYTWNARNQLTGISGPGVNASLVYDGLGRRQKKTINGTLTEYLHDALNPVQETSGAAVTANLLTGLGIDEYFSRSDSLGTNFILGDALGSALALADPTGTVQTEYTYEPFGKTTVTGLSSFNPFQYTGRENDGTDLYYYRNRYYHPVLQRFISEDPIGFASGDENLYSYVLNSPLNHIDPEGLSSDKYVPDVHKHGGPHIDRYTRQGQNVGRYRPDGTPIPHGGKTPPPIPKSDMGKFGKAIGKLGKLMKGAGLVGAILGELFFPDDAGAGSDEVPKSKSADQGTNGRSSGVVNDGW